MIYRNGLHKLLLISSFSRQIRAKCHTLSGKDLSIVFFGNDSFSLSSLKPLHGKLVSGSDLIRQLTVVSVSHSIISQFANKNGLHLLTWPLYELDHSYDVGIVVSFGHLIHENMIRECRMGILNVHGSLLPRWRGASPVHHAVLAGDAVTGVTVMLIEPLKFDVGAILAQEKYDMPDRASTAAVHADLARLGGQLLLQAVQDLPESLKHARPQPREGMTHAPKPKKQDGHIRFDEMTSVDVDRKCRALQGMVDLYCEWVDGKRLKLSDVVDPAILQSQPLDHIIGEDCTPGSIVYNKRRRILCFKCKDGNWIGFESATMHGNRNMSALEFFNGYMSRLLKNPCPGCKLKQIKL